MIKGNVDGIRDVDLKELETIYDLKTPKYQFISDEILEIINRLTLKINREISVSVDRRGDVSEVTLGSSQDVSLPVIEARDNRLSRIRVIHTHPNGNARLSAMDISALVQLRLDSIIAVGVKEKNPSVVMGFLTVQEDKLYVETTKELSMHESYNFDILSKILYNEKIIKSAKIVEDDEEKAVIVGVDSLDSLDELADLAYATEIVVTDKIFQNRMSEDKAYYVGKGKVSEIAEAIQITRSNLVIIDDEISGSQIRNLEDELGVKVIDRTTLILEIFARRAKTKEAKIQVELAQLNYRSTRLTGMGITMSRTGGGIGTRGPGEQKLEVDRRRIRERVRDLKKELDSVVSSRKLQRENRVESEIPRVSLVGYTNSGKSTLRNTLEEKYPLSSKEVNKSFEKDMLFATLDTTTRGIKIEESRPITVTDTVGFIRKLPHDLIEAFKSTLEEVIFSDLLLHIVDASSDDSLEQAKAVDEVLQEIGASDKNSIIVLNKIDKGKSYKTEEIVDMYKDKYPIVEISAKADINIEELADLIMEVLPNNLIEIKALIPYSEEALVSYFHDNGIVNEKEYKEIGTLIDGSIKKKDFHIFEDYIIGGEDE